MATHKHTVLRPAAEFLLLAAVVFGGYKLYHRWRQFEAAEQRELDGKKQWVYGRVQNSAAGSPTFMAAVAQEFTDEKDAYIGPCDWYAKPMWEHSTNNPNWVSSIKGSTGMKVIADCEIKGGAGPISDVQFDWEWEDGRGVVAMSWGWAPEYLP